MKYGINTLLWTASFDASHLALLPEIKAGGFDGVEFARFDFSGFPAAACRQALHENALEATFCTALTGDLSLIADDASQRQKTLEFLKTAVKNTAECGAQLLMGPVIAAVGHLVGRGRTDTEWSRAVEGLQALTPTLDEYQMPLAIEPLNRFETYFLNTTADALALCDAVGHPRVGMMIDSFHANIEEKDLAAAVLSAPRHLKHVHTCENDRGIPGSGHVAWQPFLNALHTIGYDRWLVIESFATALPELAAAACIWRPLAPRTEDIAYDGLKFLQQHDPS